MAAVLRPQPARHLVDVGSSPAPARVERPRLVVIEGGRSSAARARRRTFLLRRATVLAALAMGTWGVAGALAPSGPAPQLPATHVVQPGETLWGIASALPVDADVRVLVDELADANGGTGVRAGQQLVIPASLADVGR